MTLNTDFYRGPDRAARALQKTLDTTIAPATITCTTKTARYDDIYQTIR